jgi:hypothetical protein
MEESKKNIEAHGPPTPSPTTGPDAGVEEDERMSESTIL